MKFRAEVKVFDSPEQAHLALTEVGYLTDRITATTVYLAGKLHKPLLLEGPAGSGKTELSYAVTRAARTTIERLQCFEGLTAKHAIGEFDESLQRLYLELATRTETPDWKALAKEITALDFFIPGPLLKAILAKQPCVLLIDELDKVDHAIEATLLEILSVWQISDPRLGTIPAESIPFTVLTSNEERRLGDPLRRRSLYLRIEYPTPEREGEIVARRTPEASTYTHRLIAGIARALRAYRLEKPPSVSEMIDIALAIELLRIEEVTVEHRDVLLPLFAKTSRDRKKLADLKDAFASILYAAKLYARDMEMRDAADVLQQVAEEQAV
jgi:MoxR-like ATPase